MMSIAFKEGLNIPPPALNEIIVAANQDIRQVSVLSLFHNVTGDLENYLSLNGDYTNSKTLIW